MNPQVYITPDNRKVSGVPRQKARQKILRRYRLLEIDADEGFRRLLAVAARFFKVGWDNQMHYWYSTAH